ncbi:hypothetical protein FA15DRAFT_87453 [Coprinopsis marcescibilis]|uniref:Uncharacterized protein n=1 Tax=Coprinopsis marcescibilis TaxID=230819 RepID=A0A5C3L6G0_COPMA|nr:hypothetical protein FA15DRAFT_87453 [Coprinopsis marcescibilis]
MRSNACSSGKEVQPLETEVRETFSVELETLWREEKQYLMGNGNEEEASRRYAQNEEKLPQEAYATQLIPVAGKGLVAEAQSQSTGGEDEQNPSNVDGSTATKQGNNDLQEDTKLITDIEASVLQGLQKQKERLRDENSRRIKFIKKKYKQPADNSVREEKLNVVGRRSKIEEEIFKRFEQVLCKVPSEQDQEDRTEKVQNGQDEKRDEISGGRVG